MAAEHPPKTTTLPSSSEAEAMVAAGLTSQGWQIVARNLRIVGCEIDIAARKGATLAVVEVKARSRPPTTLADAEAMVGSRKRAALARGAAYVAERHGNGCETIRLDLAIVTTKQAALGGGLRIDYFPNI